MKELIPFLADGNSDGSDTCDEPASPAFRRLGELFPLTGLTGTGIPFCQCWRDAGCCAPDAHL